MHRVLGPQALAIDAMHEIGENGQSTQSISCGSCSTVSYECNDC